ncbi:MAG TPA: type IV toxin-antitoxin system AbiEi family antitoxin domain-containing protein [Kiritimatiellia bacterium]|nr:type IV toxin-antitoxin system AbiEi family antitoxin domain-containing protein [Kiritimatiellia bacterium]
MKALEWIRFLEEQRTRYGKVLFRVTELANAAGRDSHALNVELSRLLKKGVLVRYANGLYGEPGAVNVEQLTVALDPGAYITGLYALHRHNLITQVPVEITCFTNRAHSHSRKRKTPLGGMMFVHVSPQIYCRPRKGVIAGPEQAFCDFVYLARRRGVDPLSLLTFRNLEKLRVRELSAMLKKYPTTVADAVREITG